VSPNLHYIDVSLGILLGNALENAFEANIRSGRKRYVEIEITAIQTQFLCYIRNTMSSKPKSIDGILQSSKKDRFRHGIGMQSMIKTCSNLGGFMEYEFDDDIFQTWIMIPFSGDEYT